MNDLRPFLEIVALALASLSLALSIYASLIGDSSATTGLLIGSYCAMFAAYIFHE